MHEPEIAPEQLDPDAVRVVTRLKQSGFEAFLVGGCVRDLLLGRLPKDFDIATSALPNQVKELFRNSRLIGRRFRLAQVYFKGGKILEVSTFRKNPTEVEEAAAAAAPEPDTSLDLSTQVALASIEGEDVAVAPLAVSDVADGQSAAWPAPVAAPAGPDPAEAEEAIGGGVPDDDVFITQDNVFGTAIEDARRRDFTINGLFYDPAEGRVTDHVNGLRDLFHREIRTIGDPEVRMREDPVRLLRAVRFASKLDLEIEPRTYAAMEGAVEDLVRCSGARLLEETFRLIRGGVSAPSLRLLRALDALKMLLPPIDEYLNAEGPDAEAELFDFAEALDARVQAGDAFDDSMMLAALLLPVSLNLSQPGSSEQEATVVARPIETLLRELVRAARLPRRIAERTRMLLLAQPTLAGERRRRGGLQTFRRHPLFAEALKVFEVWVEATGEKADALAVWRAGGAPTPGPAAAGPRRRKRRRGRGRGGPGAAPPETA